VYVLPSLPDLSFLSPHLHIATILDSVAHGIQVQTRQPGCDLWQGHLFTKLLWLAASVLFTYVPHLMYLLPFQSGSSLVIVNCKIYSHIHILPPLSFCNNINHWSKLSLIWIELCNSRQTSKQEYSGVQHILLYVLITAGFLVPAWRYRKNYQAVFAFTSQECYFFLKPT
jgi:hypothetical protein